jgi:energy-coupling factor transport system ATP-binding protein
MNTINELNSKGVTVVMVCHDMEVVLDYARRILVLSDGRLLADGSTKEIFRAEEVLHKASILPPQIPQLALRLGQGFENAFTVEEMAQSLVARTRPQFFEVKEDAI